MIRRKINMASVNIENRNIITLAYHQEKSDADYGTCLWADFHFDCDRYTLSISSDCGNFSYGWTMTPETEDFMLLMCRVDKDYLLNKLSEESRFDQDQSVSATLTNVYHCMFQSFDDYNTVIEEIKGIEATSSSSDFWVAVDDILTRYDVIGDTYEIIVIIEDYPVQAYKIVDIFEQFIQPKLKTTFMN
jgi:hypothetical protein